jgi:UDP-galactopyranose mutase
MMRPDLAARIRGTVLTREITYSPDEPSAYEYPFPDDHNQRLYQRYRERADALANVLLCGRLGEYRYFDMDQAIARAMVLAERVLADASVVGNVDALPAV